MERVKNYERDGITEKYMDGLEFQARRSQTDTCYCEGCARLGYVTKFGIPSTMYHNGRTLSTVWKENWLCDECRDKLMAALEGVREEEIGDG